MTYEQFLNEADEHIGEKVTFTAFDTVTGKMRTYTRINWDGRKGWTEHPNRFEIVSCEWC